MRKHTVLICDDDVAVRDSLGDYLVNEDIEVLFADNAEEALRQIQCYHVDVAVLDIMLPGISGIEACRKIRESYDIPIIMLSAKGNVSDRITGLEAGADDYVAKPFSPREMMIRIKRILQRMKTNKRPRTLTFAELIVYPEGNQASVGGRTVALTAKETQVLAFIVGNAGKISTREQILNAVWGYEYFGDTRVVDTLVKRIRKKIMQDGVHFAISSVYGIGYKIEEAE